VPDKSVCSVGADAIVCAAGIAASAGGEVAEGSALVAAARRRPRRDLLRVGAAAFVFSGAVVAEFAFCPELPARTGKSKQNAETARTSANSKLLKRTIFMLMNLPPM
jgi:hypothetical protein